MQKTIRLAELEGSFQVVLDEVVNSHTSYVLTREREPTAALVPYEDYERLRQLSEKDVLRRFDETRARICQRTALFHDEDIAADVAAARAELLD